MGGQDIFGAYEVVKDWPQNISTLPGNEKWTWGAGQSIYAESPNRVFLLFRGELPNIKRPATETASRLRPEPAVSHRAPALARRHRVRAARRRAARARIPTTAQDWLEGHRRAWTPSGNTASTVVDANGKIIETLDRSGTKSSSVRTTSPSIPTIPEKHVWVVDDHMHAIYKFTHDGKELVQTIGTPTVKGADGTHFNRPTFLAWLPDSTMFVADGYNGTRVAKFDKDGKFLMDWGKKGTPPNDKRPGYMNNVHGIAVDPADAPRLRQRSRQSPHPGLRRKRQISLRMEPGRGAVRHSPASISAPTARCGPSTAAHPRC